MLVAYTVRTPRLNKVKPVQLRYLKSWFEICLLEMTRKHSQQIGKT